MIHRPLLAGLTGLLMLASASAMADQSIDDAAKKVANGAGCFT